MSGTVDLRPAGPDDEPLLCEMVRLAAGWREQAAAPLTPALEAYVRGFGRPGDRGVVAERGGRPLGAAWYRLMGRAGHGFAAPDIPELAIAVLPHARGTGVGGALLAELLAAGEAQGLRGVSLSVEPDNPARRLYERHGFVHTGASGGAWTMVRLARMAPAR